MKNEVLKNKTGFKNAEGKLHRGKIFLGKPYLQEMEGGKVRLCASFLMDERKETLWIEVDSRWGRFLVTEYSDPFVLAVVELGMKHAYDVYFEQPMSESLYYNLSTYLIPVYARNIGMFHEIDLCGETTADLVHTEAKVGTGFSAGVDSFYAVLKHMGNQKCPQHNVTHLLLAVNGAAITGVDRQLDKKWLENTREKIAPYAQKLGLELVCADSNFVSLYVNDRALDGDTVFTSAFVHALRKLFGTYYWASAYPAEILDFSKEGQGHWENLAVPYVSVDGLRFYHSGSETNRIGKVEFIADNPIVQESLTVCGNASACNCGRCFKCLRTMSELKALGKLPLFTKAFPVEDYEKHFSARLARELVIDNSPFTTDILDRMKKEGIHIPLTVYVRMPFCRIYEWLRLHLNKSRQLRKIWYRFNLDERIGGQRVPDDERKIRLNG